MENFDESQEKSLIRRRYLKNKRMGQNANA